jgi:RND family efflux transporter MFP subunit
MKRILPKAMIAIVMAFAGIGAVVYLGKGTDSPVTAAPSEEPAPSHEASEPTGTFVRAVHPTRGAVEHVTTQPGTVMAYESVQLYAKVAGFLQTQTVDIGDKVKRGQVLAVVDVPEIKTLVARNRAAVDQANARVVQMNAHLKGAFAELDAAKAAVDQAEAAMKSASAWVRYRSKKLHRMEALFAQRSIEEALVDEAKEQYEATLETERAAQANIATARSKVASTTAKIDQAKADVSEAESEVNLAKADLEKSQVQLDFATITAPFDGVITGRNLFPGDFVRAANQGGVFEPLLTIQRTDLMRVVVQVPDRDVPFVDPGDVADIEIDAIASEKFTGKVSRLANAEDPTTRLMRVEIDVPNPTGRIRHGMFGKVTIVLDREADALSIPSSCRCQHHPKEQTSVFVVRDGRAHRVPVRLGIDNGLRVVVRDGLTTTDDVIVAPGGAIREGTPVSSTD